MQGKVVTFFARDIQAGGKQMMFLLLIILCFCPYDAVMSSDSKDCNVHFDYFSEYSFSFQQPLFLLSSRNALQGPRSCCNC